VSFLGHRVSTQRVETDYEKISAVREWSVPTNVTKLRGFLGLIGYYGQFVKDYGKIALPLNDLTKKIAFSWSSVAQKAFEKLKVVLISALY